MPKEKFVYPERQVISKENYKKFLEAQENTKNLIDEIENEINSAKKERSMYEGFVKKLEGETSPEMVKKRKDYQTNVAIITHAIEIEKALQADLIKKYVILGKTVFCEE